MMKILILPAYEYPEEVASSHLARGRNAAFVKNNAQIDIVAPSPCRGLSEEDYKKYKKIRHESFEEGRINIYRFPMYREGRNPILRAVRYSLCWFQQKRAAKKRDYDLLLIGSTPPIQGLLGSVAKKRGRPFVYMCQDIFPDSLAGTGLAKKGGLLWKVGSFIANRVYRSADKIIVISQDFKKNLLAKGVPEEKIEVIYNWVDENAVQPVAKAENPLYEEFGLSREAFTVVYAGNLGNAQNISIILDAAPHLLDVQFVIFGTGGLEDEIRARIRKENLQNVELLPLQPSERVSQVYSLGDACVVSCKAGLGGSAMPSKTWTIMSCGRPVIASFDEGEFKEIIEGTSAASTCSAIGSEAARPCGVFTHAGNVTEFVEAVRSLMTDRERCAQMGRNARQFILDNLTKEVGTRKYVEVIRSFAQRQP